MNGPGPGDGPDASLSSPLRDSLREAAGYWELRRVSFNALLSAVVAGWVLAAWPHFRAALTLHSFLLMLALAAIANACYSLAYFADVALQLSRLRAAWLRHRWMLWAAGTLFAALLTCYWMADEIYPVVGAS